MRLLGVFRLGFVDAHFFVDAIGAIELGGDFAQLAHRLRRERYGVSTHVRDEANAAIGADFHALVELLGNTHGAPRVEAELACRLLL